MIDMTDDDYMLMQSRVEMLARFLLDTDPDKLTAFIARSEEADAFAPFFDPAAWMTGRGQLSRVTAHARAIAKARDAVAATVAGAR